MSLIACLSALIQQIILETLLASLSLFPLGCAAAPRQSLSHQIVLYYHTNISSNPKRKTRQMTKWLFSFALKILNFKENFNKYLKMCRFVFILTSVLALAGVHLSGRATRSLSQSDLIVTSHVTKNSSKFRPAHWARSNSVPLSRAGSGQLYLPTWPVGRELSPPKWQLSVQKRRHFTIVCVCSLGFEFVFHPQT